MKVLVLIHAIFTLGLVHKTSGEVYDFIVVGGGTAGCVVASRLSENPNFSVLLLEAGDYPDPVLEIPVFAINATFPPTENWVKVYKSVPQKHAGLSNNGIVSFLAGNVTGGGSTINGMYFNRGSEFDYDNWAKLTRDESWSYKNMLKYFKRIEDYKGEFPSDQRGFGGPITVSHPTYAPGEQIWLQAGKQLGFTSDVDPNGPQKISFTKADHSKKFGRRVTSFNGYISPILHTRPNLKVIVTAKVSRVLFHEQRAVGVVYRLGSSEKLQFAHCTKEVILSAGVMESPTILMRSGIGPKEVLEESKIHPVSILPAVGKNLQDHIAIRLEIVMNNSVVLDVDRDLTPEAWQIFNTIGDGPYSSWGGCHGQVFFRSPQSLVSEHLGDFENKNWPNLHGIVLFGSVYKSHPLFGIRPEIRLAPWEGQGIYFAYVSRPKSRGIVTLNKTNIEGHPIIDFQYLTHPHDVDALLHVIQLGLDVIEKTPSFQEIRARYPPNPIEHCKHLVFRSQEYWRCYIRQTAASALHAGGTCRMGYGSQDPYAVVDSKLKVIGVHGLRVADASIMPAVVNANSQAAAYVIGEKASSMILSEHS